MAYLALYRRFRPKTFEEVVGQEHIVTTLVNQIKTDRIGHAYLFCGARGTGKTSCARVFARAINCLNPVNGSPCGECKVCKSLAEASNLDIQEIDAASNNSVDNIREIRDKVQYPPVSGKYKVYIIDEVHMLSSGAFNALLKTLEEPPKHAVFILATTEVHKLPATILSRCMRFDFSLLPTVKIAEYIAKVYDEIGKSYENEAVNAIAKAGEGSLRDALSVADICISVSGGKLTYSDVLGVLGATDRDKIINLIKNILAGDVGSVFTSVDELSDSGKSMGVLSRDVTQTFRDVIVCKTCKDANKILVLPEDKYNELKLIAETADNHRLLRAVEIFGAVDSDLKYSTQPRIIFETAAVKAAQPENDYNIDALLSRVSKLENQLSGMIKNGISVKTEEKCVTDVSEVKEEIPFETENISEQEEDFPPEEILPESGFDTEETSEIVNACKENSVKSEPVKQTEVKNDLPQSEMSALKLWGTVIRNLRSGGNIMLWVACQEMRAELIGKTLRIITGGESEYAVLTKESNFKILTDIVKSIGDYNVEILKNAPDNGGVDKFEEDIKEVGKTFGEGLINIK